MDIQRIHYILRNSIGEKRYHHSVGVMETAKELSAVYGCDVKKAGIAGLLHDCGRIEDDGVLLKLAMDSDIILDDITKNNPKLIHGYLGAEIAKNEYGINDREILDAIRYHTTGKPRMSLLEKIIYIADYIEPGREFPGVEDVRKLAYINLDESLLAAMDNTIKYIIENGWLLHNNTVMARNELILEIGGKIGDRT
jgi:predicted HD superfamily hydrolase involved in NAD metabolism